MDVDRELGELLEALWTLEEQGEALPQDIRQIAHTEVTDQLLERAIQEGLIARQPSGHLRLTPMGRSVAMPIIRRHRLAERLMCDILGVDVEETEAAACEFEHFIAEGITRAICTLLGHPRVCPHGRPIPEGACCRQAEEQVSALLVSCDRLALGETARVAYVSTRSHPRLLKLSALGILPGISVKLLQKWPSIVLQCEETEIALDQETAREIYVWRSNEDESEESEPLS
ncbi:MAG: metal-dependent transcriptional regulator [Blastocatellia bacterium]|nr:metal-dependent transcriptional regulator [Blastocatellia bacterium]